MNSPLLSVKNLSISFERNGQAFNAVESINFEIREGEVLGIVGESGCGKTATAMSLLRLLPNPRGRIIEGKIDFREEDLVSISLPRLYKIRGGEIGFIFQEPMSALNPVIAIGSQLVESICLHRSTTKKKARDIAVSLLEEVGIDKATNRFKSYPHELSGGLRQRVGIALALAGNPSLIIADEPTSSLDVSHKAQIVELLNKLRKKRGLSILFITHELGILRHLCDRIAVMYAGQIVELAPTEDLFNQAKHPYTCALIKAKPSLCSPKQERLLSIPGQVPALEDIQEGCRFFERCAHAKSVCRENPPWNQTSIGHARCCRLDEIRLNLAMKPSKATQTGNF